MSATALRYLLLAAQVDASKRRLKELWSQLTPEEKEMVAAKRESINPIIVNVEPLPIANGNGNDLSAREQEVLQDIARGYTNKEIAAKLKISVKTIETYKARGSEKLGLRNRVDLIRHAFEQGWFKGEFESSASLDIEDCES